MLNMKRTQCNHEEDSEKLAKHARHNTVFWTRAEMSCYEDLASGVWSMSYKQTRSDCEP